MTHPNREELAGRPPAELVEVRPMFRVGDRVVCVRDDSRAGWTGKVTKGETYTVSEVFDNGWMRGVNLAEAPLADGVPRYSMSRFRLLSAGEG